jgi:hypothetical protein
MRKLVARVPARDVASSGPVTLYWRPHSDDSSVGATNKGAAVQSFHVRRKLSRLTLLTVENPGRCQAPVVDVDLSPVGEGEDFEIGLELVQMHEALQVRLKIVGRHPGDGDAIVVSEFDHGVAVRIGGDQRRQLLNGLNVGEVIELDCIGLWIQVEDCVGADARLEHECIVASIDRG